MYEKDMRIQREKTTSGVRITEQSVAKKEDLGDQIF